MAVHAGKEKERELRGRKICGKSGGTADKTFEVSTTLPLQR
jgi:hypothetical protein